MEWNEKSPLQWDWENQGLFSGSELGYNSSKNSISASNDSSLKSPIKAVEDLPKGLNKNKDLARAEPLIGLKLGKRTYFEDVGVGNNNMTKNSNSSTSLAGSTMVGKKTRASQQSVANSHCQVEGCNTDLTGAKDYHRKHRVCEIHSKCPKVVVAGQERRFCQQCSRFHGLSEFDHKKRSCRRRLSDHNARRRKPQAETISFNSSSYSSPYYDDRQQMHFLLNRAPFGILRQNSSSTWEDSCGFSLTHSKGSWINKSTKLEGMEEHNQFSNSILSNSIPSLALDLDKLLPFKGPTPEILGQGIDASISASNLDRSALSLLSSDSWVSSNLGPSNLSQQFVNTNHNEMDVYWKDQPTLPQQARTLLPQQSRVLPFELQNNGTQYETPFFDSSQILTKSDAQFRV